jgi:hypothetical protein
MRNYDALLRFPREPKRYWAASTGFVEVRRAPVK